MIPILYHKVFTVTIFCYVNNLYYRLSYPNLLLKLFLVTIIYQCNLLLNFII
ncbi:hypothetical protein LEQ41_07620 [Streptococcus agalactiae]|nr:hypothetical protein [Streptococcus agalactiae]